MKKLIDFKSVLCLFSVFTSMAILQSCVVYQPNSQQQITVPDGYYGWGWGPTIILSEHRSFGGGFHGGFHGGRR